MLPVHPHPEGANTTTSSEYSDTIHDTPSTTPVTTKGSPAPSLSSSRSTLSQSSSDSNLAILLPPIDPHHIDHILPSASTHAMSSITTNDHMVYTNNNTDATNKQYPSIPSELIVYIFKFLSNPLDLRSAILVCKLWCSCGVDLLWSRPALLSIPLATKMCDIMTLDRTQTIFPYATYIRRLNFSFLVQELTDETLVRFSNCTRLERLLLPGCNKATEEGLKQILQAGKGLYSLDLSEIPAVTDAVLDSVARFCPKLHTLYLAGCAAITDDAIMQLAASCTSLKRVSISSICL
jgi:hypothetical protein